VKRSTRYGITIVFFALYIALAAPTAKSQDSDVTVIEGGTLIDGNGGQPVSDSLIVIRGNRIETVSKKGQATYPPGAKVLHADGKFILPGLMDSHVHYAWWMAELMLNYGVTSIFEVGGGGEIGIAQREAINRHKTPGPRLFLAVGSIAGARIAEVGGRSPLEGELASRRVINTTDGARQTVQRFIAAGADMIKVHRGPSAEVYRAAIEEAHKAGLPVVAQPLGPYVYGREAVLAGADVLEHAAGIEYSIAKDPAKLKDWGDIEAHSVTAEGWAEMDDTKAADMIQLLVQHNVALEPDFVCKGRGLFNAPDKRDLFELEDYRLLSRLELSYLPRRVPAKWLRNYSEFDELPLEYQQRRVQGLKNMMRFIAQYVKAGGRVLAGTDSPGWAASGIGLHHEMNMMVAAGLTPMQVIQAATRNAAEAWHQKDKLGTVEKGKLADLVVVNADPLQDINNMAKIEWVLQDGRIVNTGFHASFKPPLIASNVEGLNWYAALKKETMNADPTWAFGWPPPGIEAISPKIVKEGDPTVTLAVKGVNFVKKSLVYFDGQALPTQVVSGTEIRATIDASLIANAGTFSIVVRNPEPLQREEWGNGSSNAANLLVNFRY